MVLSTWGPEKAADGSTVTIWYPSFYDCDTILGISNNGQVTHDAGMDMTKLDGSQGDYMTSDSALWVKLRRNFDKEITARYKELRFGELVDGVRKPGLFSVDNIMGFYDSVIGQIGQKFYNMDCARKYLTPEGEQWSWMCGGTRRDRTFRWLTERFIYMDSVYEAEEFQDSTSVIRTNVMKNATIRLKTYSPQLIKIRFSDRSTDYVKKYVNKDKWYEFTGRLDAVDNNVTIYGSYNLMDIAGINDLNVSFVNIGKAKKLSSINFSGSSHIKNISLGENTYLQRIDAYNCPKLGSDISGQVLNLEKCVNLRHLNCSNTALGGVVFPPNGGVIDSLDVSHTKITSFKLVGQEYLEALDLSSCTELSMFEVDSCNSLTEVIMPDTKLETFRAIACGNITKIDISNTKFLTTLDIQGCPNLTILKMANVSNRNITDLDLRTALNLEELDISGSTSIENITFGKYANSSGQTVNFNKLKKFTCNNSAIKSIRFGNDPIPEYLDLGAFTLTSVYFRGCKSLKEIRNLNVVTSSANFMFGDCSALTTIQGSLTVNGSMAQCFYFSANIETFPTMHLANTTSLNEAFIGCKYVTMDLVKKILLGGGGYTPVSSKLTTLNRAFSGCNGSEENQGIAGMLPSNIFQNCTGVTDMTYAFNGCSKITGYLPYNILHPATALKETYYMFAGCKIYGTEKDGTLYGKIHPDFFIYNRALTSVRGLFANMYLTAPPDSNLFRNNNNMEYMDACFANNTQMVGTIPDGLFNYMNSLVNINSFFSGCKQLSGPIPRNVFKHTYNGATSKLTHIGGFFKDVNITGTIPEYIDSSNKGLLDDLVSLKEAYNLFSGCIGLVGTIPPNLFKYNNSLTRIDGFFSGCSGLTGTIPPDLLKGKKNLLQVNHLFNGCKELSSEIPQGFFDDNSSINNISYLFAGCSRLYGQIPRRESTFTPDNEMNTLTNGIADERLESGEILRKIRRKVMDGSELWTLDSTSGNHIIVYLNVSEMLQIDGIRPHIECLNSNVTILTDKVEQTVTGPVTTPAEDQVADYDRCAWAKADSKDIYVKFPKSVVGGDTIAHWKTYLLNNNLTFLYQLEFNEIIAADAQIEHVVKLGLFDNLVNIREAEATFKGCTGLNSEIPETLFDKCSSVTTLNSFFENCFYLSGRIPSGLLKNCVSLRYADNFFRNCCSLYDGNLDEEYPYALPPDLFENCRNLESITGFLNMWNEKEVRPHAPKITGSIPAELFANCTKLKNINSWLNTCTQINGPLAGNLFEACTLLESTHRAFAGTSITALGEDLFYTCTKLKDMGYTFSGCSSLRGRAPEFWAPQHPINPSTVQGCFGGCTGLDNYADIDPNWK